MYLVSILLSIVAICAHFNTGFAVTPPPLLKYDCDSDGTITIYTDGLDDYPSIYARGTVNSKVGDCTVSNLNSPLKFKITNCKPDQPITVVIMRIPKQDQINGQVLTNGTTLGPKTFVIGGDGMTAYTIKCYVASQVMHPVQELPKAFAVKINGGLPIKSTLSPTAVENNVGMLMSIRKGDSTSLVQSETIALGEELLVVISGPAGPTYFVKECSAYDPDSKNETSINLILNGNQINEALMTAFTAPDLAKLPKLAPLCPAKILCQHSKLHAFHFKDANKVTLECTVVVCNSNDVQDCKHTRKRREAKTDANIGTHVRTLSETITVSDSLQMETPVATSGSARNLMICGMMLVVSGFVWISM